MIFGKLYFQFHKELFKKKDFIYCHSLRSIQSNYPKFSRDEFKRCASLVCAN